MIRSIPAFGTRTGSRFGAPTNLAARALPTTGFSSRSSALAATTAMAAALACIIAADRAEAQANDACGPLDAAGSVHCAPTGNPYPDGIRYRTPAVVPGADVTDPATPVIDLSVALDSGSQVAVAAPFGLGVDLGAYNNGSVALHSAPGTSVSTTGANQIGVRAFSAWGNVMIEAPDVVTTGNGADGIVGSSTYGGSVDIVARSVATSGLQADGINITNTNGGAISVTASGAVATTGARSLGVYAYSNGGTATVDVGDVSTRGDFAPAIVAGGDSSAVTIRGAVSTAGQQSYGAFVRGYAGTASLQLDGSVATTGDFSRGIDIHGTDGVSVTGTGSVDTWGFVSSGVSAVSDGGDVVVDLARVTTAGDSSNGVSASSGGGNVRVDLGRVGTAGQDANAVNAFSSYGDVTVGIGSASTLGDRSDAINVEAGGDAVITVGNVSTSGMDSRAINASGRSIDLTIDGRIRALGGTSSYSAAVLLNTSVNPGDEGLAGAGTVTARINGLVGATGDHVDAIGINASADVTISGSGKVRTTGYQAYGVRFASGGPASIALGSVGTTGVYADAVHGTSQGRLSIDIGTITTAGDGARGIAAISYGGADIMVGSVSTIGANATGIRLDSFGDDAVSVKAGMVSSAHGTGIKVIGTGGGAITISADSALAAGDGNAGIFAQNHHASIAVTVGDAVASGVHAAGVYADGFDSAITVTGTVRVTAPVDFDTPAVSAGVYARATQHASIVNDGDISIEGASVAAIAARGRSVTVVSHGAIAASGIISNGVRASSTDGDIVLDLATVDVTGFSPFGVVTLSESGNQHITVGTVSALGLGGYGILAQSGDSGDITITATGAITASKVGIDVETRGGPRVGGTATVSVQDISVFNSDDVALQTIALNSNVTINGTITQSGLPLLSDVTGWAVLAQGGDGILTGTSLNGFAHVANNGLVHVAGQNARGIFVTAGLEATLTGGGSIQTDHDQSAGAEVDSQFAGITVAQHSIETFGARSDGLDALAFGASSIAIDRLATHGADSLGMSARLFDAATIQIGSVTTDGQNATGMKLRTLGSFALTLDSGITLGDNAGLLAITSRGDIDLTIGSGSTAGESSSAIFASTSGNATVVTGTIDTIGSQSRGLDLSIGGSAFVTGGSTTTAGAYAGAISVVAGGDVTIHQDQAITLGDYANAITAVSSNGAIAVTAGRVGTRGRYSNGVFALNYGPGATSVTVDQGETYGLGATAIRAIGAGGGTVSITAGTIVTHGDLAAGISASSAGLVDVAAGDVATSGFEANAIQASSNAGLTIATTGLISVGGDQSTAIRASSGGTLSIDAQSLDVAGAGSRGIDALSGGAGYIHLSGTVTGSSDQPAPAIVVPIGPSGRLPDIAAGLISLQSYSTAMVVSDAAITTSGTLEGGISARGYGGVQISGSGNVVTHGDGATAIYAGSNSIGSFIGQQSIETTGTKAIGAFARSYGLAAVQIGSVATSGDRSIGILAEGVQAAYVDADSVVTHGALASGIVAHSYGQAYISAGSVTVTGAGARGIDAASYAQGDAIVVVHSVHASDGMGIAAFAANGMAGVYADDVVQGGQGHGIIASGQAGATVDFGTVVSNGEGQWAGIAAFTYSGDVVVQGGGVSASGSLRDAIAAATLAGNVTVTTSGTVSANGSDAAGIFADAAGGLVDVRANIVSSSGTSVGALLARGDGVSVVAGNVLATGNNGTSGALAALTAIARNGSADVTLGTVRATGTGFDGVSITASGAGSLTIVSGGGVSATHDAVVVQTGTSSTLANAGTITAGTGAAVRVTGGATTISNSGSITGALVLTDLADLVTNSGTLTLDRGTSFGAGDDRLVNGGTLTLDGDIDFGTGHDSLVNQGTLKLSSALATSGIRAEAVMPVSRSITGVESFANSGLIDLRSGVAGDTLSISGGFTGSGASALALDVQFGASPVADRLVLAGAATGSTTVYLDSLGQGGSLQPGVVIVKAGAGTEAGAFTLAASQRVNGLFERGLVFDANAGTFALVSAPSNVSYKLLKVSEGAQSLWLGSADAVTARLAADRDSPSGLRGFWMSVVGNVATRDETRTFTSFGLSQTADLGYKQDVFGTQFGVDSGGTGFSFGVTGGYASSTMTFRGSADRVNFDAVNAGLYAGARKGMFFADALAKYDHYLLHTSLGSVGERARSNGDGYGGRIEAGLRLGSGSVHVEPSVSVSWAFVDLDPLALGETVSFADRAGGRATAGLKLGKGFDLHGAWVNLYAQGEAVRPFGRRDGVRFTTGATTLAVGDRTFGTYGAGKFGASITSGKVSGFIEADGRYGDDYRGGGGRVGLRIGF